MGCLCKLLEADAPSVLGGDAGRFPLVLGAMAAAYESELTGEAASARMKSLVRQWHGSNPDALRASACGLPAPQQEKLGRMAA